MSGIPRPRHTFLLVMATAYVTILTVAVVTLPYLPDGRTRLLALLLYIAFAVLLVPAYPLQRHVAWLSLLLAIESAIIITIFWLHPRTADDVFILFFVLSGVAPFFLPIRFAAPWVIAFYLLTLLNVGVAYGRVAVFEWLTAGGGVMFFGVFGGLLRQANAAYYRTQQLLEELREAHAQLQDYAAQVQQLAVAEERNRLAREMHDALGHRLIVTVVQLEGAQRLIPTEPGRAATIIGEMRSQLKQALAELRNTVTTLRTPPNGIDNVTGSFETALSSLAHTFAQATGLPVHLELPPQLPLLPAAHRLTLYRTAQEGLTNVQRHAAASKAWLALLLGDDFVALTVADDGRGLEELDADGRFGLQGLRERAEKLGGALHLEERTAGGLVLRLQLPLPPTMARDEQPAAMISDG